jgi:hypothetical protein
MNDTITHSPETLCDQMVDRITAAGWAHAPRVAEAMRQCPGTCSFPTLRTPRRTTTGL